MSTSLASVSYPARHPGVERPFGVLARIGRLFDGARAMPSLLLAAMVAALVVVANQVVDTWTEGHLLVAWIVLWTVAFAALALLAAPARSVSRALRAALQAWNERRFQAAQDELYWQSALADSRIMADLICARSAATPDDASRSSRGAAGGIPVFSRVVMLAVRAIPAPLHRVLDAWAERQAGQRRARRLLRAAR